MALDEALVASVREGGAPVLRLYRWSPACLSLGRNQPARGRYDLERITAAGMDVVRRTTGGRAVLHHRELTYAAVLPIGLLGTVRESYLRINRALAAGLRSLGASVSVAQEGVGRAPAPSLAPCFADPLAGEVVADGRKLVGSAVWRSGDVLLQHGSLLLEDDQQSLPGLLAEPGDPAPPVATLAGLLGRVPDWSELSAAVSGGWEEALGTSLRTGRPASKEQANALRLEARFRSDAWTWRR